MGLWLLFLAFFWYAGNDAMVGVERLLLCEVPPGMSLTEVGGLSRDLCVRSPPRHSSTLLDGSYFLLLFQGIWPAADEHGAWSLIRLRIFFFPLGVKAEIYLVGDSEEIYLSLQ